MILDYTQYQHQRWLGQVAFNTLAFGLQVQSRFLAAAGMPVTARYLHASSEMAERMGKDYPDPGFNLTKTTIGAEEISVGEEIIEEKTFGSLLHFKRDSNRNDPKVLLVAPLSGHHPTLLRDTVKGLLPHHDVYITDWKDARDIPADKGDFSLDDYIGYIQEFIETLGPDTHVMAVCQPTVPVLATTALMAANKSKCQPLSMTLINGPIDVRFAETEVTRYAKEHSYDWFKDNVITEVPASYAGAGRKVYPGYIQLAGFTSMNKKRHVESHVDLFNNLAKGDHEKAEATKKFYDDFNAVLDMPARYYLETIREVFQKASLASGEMKVNGQHIDPSRITKTMLFTVECAKDDISAPGQTFAAHVLCSGLKAHQHYHYEQEDAGHYGGFSGSKFHKNILPRITAVIREAGRRNGFDYDDIPQSDTALSIMPERADPKKIATLAATMHEAKIEAQSANSLSSLRLAA